MPPDAGFILPEERAANASRTIYGENRMQDLLPLANQVGERL
jgi:hypothetical protein